MLDNAAHIDAALEQQARRAMQQGRNLPWGSTERSAAMDRAVALADQSGSLKMRFDTRQESVMTACFARESDVLLAAYAWCQRAVDERPDLFSQEDLLWESKFAVGSLAGFARIPQERIDAILADQERRFESSGASPRTVLLGRSYVAQNQGRIAEARALREQAMRHPRDRWSDCAACELDTTVEFLNEDGRHEEAIAAAAPILAGVLSCAEVPARTLTRLLEAHAALGQDEQARELQPRAYRQVCKGPGYIGFIPVHIRYLVDEGKLAQAARVALRHLPWYKANHTDDTHELHARTLAHLLRAIAARHKKMPDWAVALLDGLEQHDARYKTSGEDITSEARLRQAWHSATAFGRGKAAALDTRNGNQYFSDKWRGLDPEGA